MSIKNGDLPAMPAVLEELIGRSGNEQHYGDVKYAGMTKREMFAMVAMQGLMANTSSSIAFHSRDAVVMSKYAIANADALLAELEKAK